MELDAAREWTERLRERGKSVVYTFVSEAQGYGVTVFSSRHAKLLYNKDECQRYLEGEDVMDDLPKRAEEFLQRSIDLLAERGKTYDSQQKSERSMQKTVDLFNLLTGNDMSTRDGWLIMILLKLVRQESSPTAHRDSAEDLVSYAALFAESLFDE